MDSIHGCKYRIVHVKPTANKALTDYVINVRTGGHCIGIIRDKDGGGTHAIRIDISKRFIYDSMETLISKLSNESLNKYFGQDRKFDKF